MCFQKFYGVDWVAEPDMSTTFEVFEGLVPVDMHDADLQVSAAARIYLDNAVVTQALKEIEKHGVVEEIEDPATVKELWDRGFAFTSVMVNHGLDYNSIHPEQRWTSHDVRLKDKIIVLQLEDFSFLAQYSFGPVRGDLPLPPGCVLRKEIRVKFGMASSQGILYNVVNWPTLEMLTPRPVDFSEWHTSK
jgi:hypothetical protein